MLTRPGPNIFFYLNHPIRFVCVVGVIVARTDVYKRTILTLDDSSGATIDITVLKAELDQGQGQSQDRPEPEPEPESEQPKPSPAQQEQGEMHLTTTTQDIIDINSLTAGTGTVVKIKGTVSTFRSQIQLQLERFFPIADTNDEMRFLDQRTRVLVEVLSVPWELSGDEVAELHRRSLEQETRVAEEQEKVRKRQRRRIEREERDQKRILRSWQREEVVREREALDCRDAGRRVMWELGRR